MGFLHEQVKGCDNDQQHILFADIKGELERLQSCWLDRGFLWRLGDVWARFSLESIDEEEQKRWHDQHPRYAVFSQYVTEKITTVTAIMFQSCERSWSD